MKVRIIVNLKPSVLDPQGKAVCGALKNLGFDNVKDVRVGKVIYVSLEGVEKDQIKDIVDDMCAKLLVNPVIETYEWDIVEE
ncbi:phosphoribosylformylglycinamidine synthase [Thermosulfidibacter takaii ABI70S6]|uniref:Phosphoribosylformylglycinamidine synthase subunit PurS n=1 Tax=Thermosulfidibacter takaii (strain DSM 17441 / JCM 13301 / NBRC 103674 / ABI70S6) TaxID=1298851 RepID=A0A0S3QVV9_THET7|nr:phosphoribosylformylglycinamidine synthase subunit PurS [Thermosulfidibacter takaii]BAT72464.1 phosphoribosylformylglycinamidine synthase [Thermosulfidibacter takaii ABI70S6]